MRAVPSPSGEGQGEGKRREPPSRVSDCSRNCRTGRVLRQSPRFPKMTMSSRVILITGANGALGDAIARAFLGESSQNIVWLGVHSNRANAETLSRENAGRCRLVDLDVTSPAAWQKAVHCI